MVTPSHNTSVGVRLLRGHPASSVCESGSVRDMKTQQAHSPSGVLAAQHDERSGIAKLPQKILISSPTFNFAGEPHIIRSSPHCGHESVGSGLPGTPVYQRPSPWGLGGSHRPQAGVGGM